LADYFELELPAFFGDVTVIPSDFATDAAVDVDTVTTFTVSRPRSSTSKNGSWVVPLLDFSDATMTP
jgi:hypothetical protein